MYAGHKVLSMNASDNGSKGDGEAEKIDEICKILSMEQPDLVMLQECSSTKKLQDRLDREQWGTVEYQICQGPKDSTGSHSCILFNVNSLQILPHDCHKTYRELVDNGKISTDGKFPKRLFTRLCLSKGKPHLCLLVGSYHARNKNISAEEKERVLSELTRLLDAESTKRKANILLGGDFDIEFRKARDILLNSPGYQAHSAAKNEEKEADTVAFFMYSGLQHRVYSVRALFKNKQQFQYAPLVAEINHVKRNLRPVIYVSDTKINTRVRGVEMSREDASLASTPSNQRGDACVSVCNSIESSASHTETHHDLATPVICGTCGFQCTNETELTSHEQTHRNFKCNECGRVCDSRANLASHMKTHEMPTPVSAIVSHTAPSPQNVTQNDPEYRAHNAARANDRQLVDTALLANNDGPEEQGNLIMETRMKTPPTNQSNTQQRDGGFILRGQVTTASVTFAALPSSDQRTTIETLVGSTSLNQNYRQQQEFNMSIGDLVENGVFNGYLKRQDFSPVLPGGFPCEFCGRVCKSKAGLVSHTKTHYPPEYVACSICGFLCKNNAGLSSHMRSHQNLSVAGDISGRLSNAGLASNKRSYQSKACDICGLICKSGAGLASHKRAHNRRSEY